MIELRMLVAIARMQERLERLVGRSVRPGRDGQARRRDPCTASAKVTPPPGIEQWGAVEDAIERILAQAVDPVE
ncbi:MAG TPA: hypothetical protein VGF95_14875 [Solirubrobacteraceae bacterium]|jgi:hypothetical protein